jgi:serine protease
MRKYLTLATLGFAALMTVSTGLLAQAPAAKPVAKAPAYRLPGLTPDQYMPKTIILRVKPELRSKCAVDKIDNAEAQKVFNHIGAYDLKKKYPGHAPPARELNPQGLPYADLSLIYEFKYTADVNIEKAINQLLGTGIFIYAEPHVIPKVGYAVNDPQGTSVLQYNIYKINAAGSTTSGWDTWMGDTNTVIGITDTGWEPTHSDLNDNVKKNYADPVNGVDDDLDGYIDNFLGWDVAMNDNNAAWQGDAHGVHVTGTAAAEVNNNTGVAGTGYLCKFLPVKIADASGTLTAAYDGIVYAADHGVKVINCSWGGGNSGSYGQNIIDYATINKDVLVVAAAGNDGIETDSWPAAYDYVISVANTRSNDQKNSSSTYGYHVDVCAPGTNINSTYPTNTYTQLTGTSMSSPCASGVAALIKSYFPTYTALQVGERLKQTTDNIYGVNSFYLNKLGTGRINLYKAFNDPLAPSIVMSQRTVVDNNDNAFVVGDTLNITGNFTNYLAASGNVTGTLTFAGSYLTTVDNTTSLGVLNTLQTVNNNTDPFKFKINAGTPVNSTINFTLNLSDGTYSTNIFFSVIVNVDYINITINDVFSTGTSKGMIGYNGTGQTQGLGFTYQNVGMLYEAGPMFGSSSTTVSDCVRGATAGTTDADFASAVNISQVVPSVKSDFDLTGKFNDNPASPTQTLLVTHNEYAWASAGNRKYIIWEYLIKNNGTTTLNNFYAGIFADWDIDATTYGENRSAYDSGNKMGYSYYTAASGLYAGIKLLTSTAAPNFYAIDNVTGGSGGADLSDGYSAAEKYTTLTTQRLAAGTAGTGADVINVMSTGPYTLAPGDTAVVAFALIAGDDLTDLQTSAGNAQVMYDGLTTTLPKYAEAGNFFIYPNPAQNNFTVDLGVDAKNAKITVYNSLGQEMMSQNLNGSKLTLSTDKLANGNYIIRVVSDNKTSVKKFVIEK